MRYLSAKNRRDETFPLGAAARHPGFRTSGMTLVEVLVALCILSIALIVLTSIFPLALRQQDRMLYIQIASAAARSELDDLSAKAVSITKWTDITTGTATDTNKVTGLPSGNVKTVEITTYPPGSNAQYLKKIKVTITWPGRGGADYLAGKITCVTLVAKPYKETDACFADL